MKSQMEKIFLIGAAVLAMAPGALADEWNQKTIFNFSGPVEIPGRVLQAGTYVFKLADSQSFRNIVQVYNSEESQIYATFLAIPDYRMEPSDKTIITFSERPVGSPQAVKGWFYPGRTYGHEFVYPKAKAVELAHTFNTPVPAAPTELAPKMIKPAITLASPEVADIVAAPVVAEESDGTEVDINTVFTATASAPVHPELAAGADLPEELPETATPLPLIALIGVSSLGLGAALRLAPARSK